MRSGNNFFATVQKLRAVAALAVVGVHLLPQLRRLGYTGYWPDLSAGVDLFFVISGFIIWVTTADKSVSPGAFLRKRLVRIVPLYWLLTAVVVAVALVAPSLLQSTAVNSEYVLKSLLFIPAEHPVLRGEFLPVLPPGWTLELEMPFYGLMAIALVLPPRARLAALVLTLFAVALSHRLLAPDTALAFLTQELVAEFAYGLLIGAFVASGARWPFWSGLALMLMGVTSMPILTTVSPGLSAAFVPGLPVAAIVLGAVICDTSRLAIPGVWLARLGDASYSLYLSHGIFLSAILQVWRRVLPRAEVWNWVAFGLFATTSCALLSLLVYRYVERPLGEKLSISSMMSPWRQFGFRSLGNSFGGSGHETDFPQRYLRSSGRDDQRRERSGGWSRSYAAAIQPFQSLEHRNRVRSEVEPPR